MKDLKSYFPATKKQTYLNTPAIGLLPQPVIEWRRQQDENYANNPFEYLMSIHKNLASTREKISQFFGSKQSEIALIPNFSFGLNTVLEGLKSNENILLLNNEYPSVNWPVESRNFNVFYADIDAHLEENIYAAIKKNNISVFLFSVVQWLNGIKIDLEFIKQLKKDFPHLLLIADGTQYLGTEAFNFSESGIDILATSGYKWLNAGFGNGFIIVKKSVRKRIIPKVIGYNSSHNFVDKPNDEHFMKYFEPGHLDNMCMGSIAQSMDFMELLGLEKCYHHISNLAILAKATFTELGLLQHEVVQRKNHSNIFNIKGDQEVFKKLIAHQVLCIPRGSGIRVGFHFYNDENDLNRLIEVLKN